MHACARNGLRESWFLRRVVRGLFWSHSFGFHYANEDEAFWRADLFKGSDGVENIVVCGVVGGSALLFSNVGWCNDYLKAYVYLNSFAVYWAKGSSNSPLFYRIGLFYLLYFTYGLGTMRWLFVGEALMLRKAQCGAGVSYVKPYARLSLSEVWIPKNVISGVFWGERRWLKGAFC